MLEAVSCWAVDWTAIGAVATAAATVSGVVVAIYAFKANSRRQDAWMAANAVTLIMDIGGASEICRRCEKAGGSYTVDIQEMFRIGEMLRVPSTKQFLKIQGEVSAELALAAAEFAVMAEILGRNLDPKKMPTVIAQHAAWKSAIKETAMLTLEKAKRLGEVLAKEYPSCETAIASALNRDHS